MDKKQHNNGGNTHKWSCFRVEEVKSMWPLANTNQLWCVPVLGELKGGDEARLLAEAPSNDTIIWPLCSRTHPAVKFLGNSLILWFCTTAGKQSSWFKWWQNSWGKWGQWWVWPGVGDSELWSSPVRYGGAKSAGRVRQLGDLIFSRRCAVTQTWKLREMKHDN